ncbi:unnamed protein product, partial [Allacma fusca]
EEFCSYLKSVDRWNKAGKVRVQKAYQFSLKCWDMPIIVSYRFLGWVTALKSKFRAHDKEESR